MLVTMNPSPLEHSAPMLDKNNIINQRDGGSLYQICLKLRRRLALVPNFQPYLDQIAKEEADGADPVSSLWRCFRSGLPLLTIYNATEPQNGELSVDSSYSDVKMGKQAAYKFIVACMEQMSMSASELFSLNDLYGDNTTGFVKVTKQVNRVLDILQLSGRLLPPPESHGANDQTNGTTVNGGPPKSLTRRQHILKELVETERQYVHHLLNLQALKKELEECGALTGDSVHSIFLNLNNLLDFAQRFLIRIEQHNELPEESQNWGELFIHYREPFRQYEPFIANQLRCESTCRKEWDKMKRVAGGSPLLEQMLADSTILSGFLLKPFQRMTKYPLLLKDLSAQSQDENLRTDLSDAVAIITGVLHEANAAIDNETRQNALLDLNDRVEEWKTLRLDTFGDLLLFGTFTVLKGDGSKTDQEKEYHIYLFERILLCCKDINVTKQKSKYMGGKDKSSAVPKGQARLQLKGRIFLANVTHILRASGPGNHTLQIFWKGDPGVEHFVIKFTNDNTMQRWNREIEAQRAVWAESVRVAKANGTSETQFISMRGLQLENPHIGCEIDDEEYSRGGQTVYPGPEQVQHSSFSFSRNASSISLRSSSTATATAYSNGGGYSNTHPSNQGRPPPRFPMPDPSSLPPLNTSFPALSGDRGPTSYFSPLEREETTPLTASTRTSSQSAFSSYGRKGTPSNGWSSGEEHVNRNTAPAMSRNNNGGGNPYAVSGKDARSRPPPVSTGPPTPQQIANGINRMRSASSPDFANPQKRGANGSDVPTVPAIPPHVSGRVAPVNRSTNNSPTGHPARAHTPSGHAGQLGLAHGSRPSMTTHYTYDASYTKNMDPRLMTTNMISFSAISERDRNLTPPISTPSSDGEPFMPSQLKAKVCFDSNYITLVIASNIQFRSLTDRIDAKLSRFAKGSISGGSIRLRYQDEDGDFVWIDSDEAVHDAFLDWRETHADKVAAGSVGEIVLYCSSLTGEPLTG